MKEKLIFLLGIFSKLELNKSQDSILITWKLFEKESIKWCPKLFNRRVNYSFKDVLSALLSCDIMLKQFILLKVDACSQIVLVSFLWFSTVLEICIYKFYRAPPCFAQFQMWLSCFSHSELMFAFSHIKKVCSKYSWPYQILFPIFVIKSTLRGFFCSMNLNLILLVLF